MARVLRYPTGVRPLLIEAAARRRQIEDRFVRRLESAGFAEIILPILDYVEAYAVLDGDISRRTYRFTDRDGELVALRSDFTPMIARALAPTLAPTLAPDAPPLRVYYRGDVIRCDRTRLGANREMFQIGGEIVGDASIEADIEILTLAADLAGGDVDVVYTDARILTALAPETRVALASKRAANDTLASKLLNAAARLDDIRPIAPAVVESLEVLGARLDPRFRLDLSDVDPLPHYYTGLRFSVYDRATRTRVAEGGRYDSLYERFGAAAPAVGFTFTIDDLN